MADVIDLAAYRTRKQLKDLRKFLDKHPLKPSVMFMDEETARELGYEVQKLKED